MSERIVFKQNDQFQVEYYASDPRKPDDEEVQPVQGLHEVTPYGMMLFSLASCTAQVVLSYAEHHQISLRAVEFDISYERVFREDCDNCEAIDRYQEKIQEMVTFRGDFNQKQKEKLFRIAHQCPIHKMFEDGIDINSRLTR